jgi:Tfp pilus assembly pilus retraction ATPase PilT
LPQAVADLCNRPNWLILVTGPTGSGKSTTRASMFDPVNVEALNRSQPATSSSSSSRKSAS